MAWLGCAGWFCGCKWPDLGVPGGFVGASRLTLRALAASWIRARVWVEVPGFAVARAAPPTPIHAGLQPRHPAAANNFNLSDYSVFNLCKSDYIFLRQWSYIWCFDPYVIWMFENIVTLSIVKLCCGPSRTYSMFYRMCSVRMTQTASPDVCPDARCAFAAYLHG